MHVILFVSAWVTFEQSVQIISQTDTSYDAGLCQWVTNTIINITTIIEQIVNFTTAREY